MLEVFQEFSFLNLLSVLAFVTTVGLFFCGIPICRQIWKRKDTTEISGAPFLMGVLGGTCWMVYGQLKKDQTVEYVTGAQIILYSIYTVFYWFMTKKKFWITIQTLAMITICCGLVTLVHFLGHKIFHPLGFICMTLNTMDFGAPLAGLKVVIRRRATSTLPLPLCIANFMVSTEWFLYGLLVKDFYLITPNGIGSLLAFAQLILFVVLPRKPNQRAPILRLYDLFRNCCTQNSLDLEAAAVVPVDKGEPQLHHRLSKHRWSSRVMTNVAGEIENAIQKAASNLGNQFAYSNKLNKEEERSSDSGSETLTPDENRRNTTTTIVAPMDQLSVVNLPHSEPLPARSPSALDSLPPLSEYDEDEEMDDFDALDDPECGADTDIVFPITIRDPTQLFRLSKKLSSSRRGLRSNQLRASGGGDGRQKWQKFNGFDTSLQPHHFSALRDTGHHQQQSQFGGNPAIPVVTITKEAEDMAFMVPDLQPKRAKSEPNLFN